MVQINKNVEMTINSDVEYVEDMIDSILQVESSTIMKINTFSDVGWSLRGRGLVITLNDGRKYELAISGIN